MANLEILFGVLVGLALLGFLTGKLNKVVGSVFTIIATGFAFISLFYFGFYESLDPVVEYLPYVTFSISSLKIFFATLVAFIFFMVSFFNPYYVGKMKYGAVYNLLFVLSLVGALGVFFTDNFMTFFFFFEFVVWTSMFMIPLGKSKKVTSIYFGFSAFGGFALLIAILLMQNNVGSFDITLGLASLAGTEKVVVFLLILTAAFAKLGTFPLHIWLPKVLSATPDPVSAIFSGGLEKLGAFTAIFALIQIGSVGFNIPAFDIAFFNYIIAFIGAMTIVFGTLMAIKQDDAKKLLAYSSMSNGGYIIVAFSLGMTTSFSGGLYHVLAHALATTAAFLAIGAVHRQTGTTKMSELGGMIHKMPVTYLVYLIAIISMAGIPPMGGFISKWLIFQSVINKGLIFIAIATFFGSIGSFLYVFRPLAALFLGQELPEHKKTVKEAPFLLLIPMVILSLLNVVTGVVPNIILKFTNNILSDFGVDRLVLGDYIITGNNGDLHPLLIAGMFAIGVAIAFVIFILLKKSKKVDLMDTYTSGNFVYTEQHLHYTLDFYAPLERLYDKYTTIMENFYNSLSVKVKEYGELIRYYFFTYKPEITAFWILVIIGALLWGEIV